ncbi:MAG: oxidoreductase [Chloroflexi bacterium RBG_16_69_14]|nr:MAG: oxidoreductase [Chloroflexi bacterium RBG_16_69_14]
MSPAGRRSATRRPRVGVVKFASCDGCQLTVLGLEDELLAIAERFDIVEFAEATSRRSAGPFDVLLVEGSISTDEQLEELLRLRRETTTLVTIGACATAGGIQAIRNWSEYGPWAAAVYPQPELVPSLAMATPVADHVVVDAELRGCPIDPGQLLELLTALVVGRRPQLPDESVCAECKRRGAVCVVVAHGVACLGPVTRTGCGALCPVFGRGCYGCFGPRSGANVKSLIANAAGLDDSVASARFAGFTAWAEPFRSVIDSHGGPPGASPATVPTGSSERGGRS